MADTKHEKIIQQFCKDWIEWVDAGTPHGSLMLSKHKGLCANFLYWVLERGYYLDERKAALNVLCDLFLHQFGSKDFPFTTSIGIEKTHNERIAKAATQFNKEALDGTMHLNANRVAWARAQAAKLTEENV